MEVKVKKTTFGEINKRFLTGLSKLKYRPEVYKVTRGSILSAIPNEYHTAFIYIKSLDVTYVSVTCVGYIALFGPSNDDPTWVLRYPGKVTDDDIKEDELYDAILEEAGMDYKERRLEAEKEES